MESIRIENPFHLTIDLLEFEEVLPSVKLLVGCVLYSFDNKILEINNRVWVACRAWDTFVSDLNRLRTGDLTVSTLEDLSGKDLVRILRTDEVYYLNFYFARPGTLGVEAKCEVSALIDIEEIGIFSEKLNDFEKWW